MISCAIHHETGNFVLDAEFENTDGVLAFFGPSGSGKSTLINLIAGLTRLQQGRVTLGGETLDDTAAGLSMPVHRRRIGLVFQDSRLFPHLTVRQNLLFGQFLAPKSARRVAFGPLIDTLGLGALLQRRPESLSGGERQRVAIGRALLMGPRLLAMDEPLAALDDARRQEILPMIEQVRDVAGVPIIYVSHAIPEVARLAAQVIVLAKGKIVRRGAPQDVFGRSWQSDESRFDLASVLTAEIGAYDAAHGLTTIEHPAGAIQMIGRIGAAGTPTRIVIRSTDVALSRTLLSGLTMRTALQGQIDQIEMDDGPLALVHIALPGGNQLAAAVTRKAVNELGLREGDAIVALVKSVALDERQIGPSRW
ncbi:molybdenum ABC transporter ATP-binding protein [Methylovirgula sp. 4M-Z18]|uniref:molybdenum ABC transporter ATP-binding protein n=1 Tax=Methylovirgula sp. 4M-Z18 TaxID=2293567 RepID=UPI000E2E8A48|nr:molybdenum ABC transporter ATP-binding protein [Methylovirgula sp. 4M-Z18]RFB79228.1 molybdenum ABC transporter ATP-binding protein [Methylovirgula sp. 4M-Z18]